MAIRKNSSTIIENNKPIEDGTRTTGTKQLPGKPLHPPE